MSIFGLDWAWGKPSAQALRNAHVAFAGRYFSFDPGKNLTAGEYRWLQSLGIGVVVVWETTADRARAGETAGRSDALNADAQRHKCGLPDGHPIHLAVDFDAEGPEVLDYFKGAQGVLGDRCGAYAGYRAMKHLFDKGVIHHGWQTYAWSGGQWDARALVRQYSNGHVVGGVDCDYNIALPGAQVPASAFVPGDELRWRHQYDHLQHVAGPWSAMRRRVLRRYMTARRKKIWQLAAHEPHGWDKLNRANRWRSLKARTG